MQGSTRKPREIRGFFHGFLKTLPVAKPLIFFVVLRIQAISSDFPAPARYDSHTNESISLMYNTKM
jgi:hypothetical protein